MAVPIVLLVVGPVVLGRGGPEGRGGRAEALPLEVSDLVVRQPGESGPLRQLVHLVQRCGALNDQQEAYRRCVVHSVRDRLYCSLGETKKNY